MFQKEQLKMDACVILLAAKKYKTYILIGFGAATILLQRR
jgi:hypothetical protein